MACAVDGHQLLDPRRHDVHLGRGRGELGVALVGDGADGARVGDEEVGAGDADLGGEELLPQLAACALRPWPARVLARVRLAVLLLEQGRDLLLGAVHRRPDDVRRRLAGELDDVLGQIGLDPLDAGLGECHGQTDLLAQHRLHARRTACTRRPADLDDDAAGLVRGHGPVDPAAGGDRVALERLQIVVEVGDHMVLDPPPALPCGIELGEFGHGLGALALGRARGPLDRDLERAVGECCLRVRLEVLGTELHDLSPPGQWPDRHPGRPAPRWCGSSARPSGGG